MINKVSAIAVTAIALSTLLGSTAVRAQESCPAMYSHMMGIYQADPFSPAYAQMLPYYNSHCLSGASYQSPQPQAYSDPAYAPAYSQYQQPAPYGYGAPQVDPSAYAPAYSQYQQPAPYGYGAPQVDPGAAIVGAAIVGGAIAADSQYHRQDDWGNRGWHR